MARLTPVNYNMQVLNPLQTAMAGYQAGFGQFQQLEDVRRQREADRMAAEKFELEKSLLQAQTAEELRATEQAQAAQEALGNLWGRMTDGENVTVSDVEAIMVQHPSLQEALQPIGERLSAEQKQNTFMDVLKLTRLSRDPEMFRSEVQTRISAAEGDPNAQNLFRGLLQTFEAAENAEPGGGAAAMELEGGLIMMGLADNEQQREMINSVFGRPERTTLERNAMAYANLQAAPGTSEHTQAQMQFMRENATDGVSVTVGIPSKDNLTPFELEMAGEYAPIMAQWQTGGGADTAKNLSQLAEVVGRLESGEENLTGWIIGNVPDFILAGLNPEALDARELVEEVVQRNLRIVLGAQFTEKEGERLIARAYNRRLSEPQNAARLRRLIASIDSRARQLESLQRHIRRNRSPVGWDGSLATVDSLLRDLEGEGLAGGGPSPDQPMFEAGTLRQMTPEELQREAEVASVLERYPEEGR